MIVITYRSRGMDRGDMCTRSGHGESTSRIEESVFTGLDSSNGNAFDSCAIGFLVVICRGFVESFGRISDDEAD